MKLLVIKNDEESNKNPYYANEEIKGIIRWMINSSITPHTLLFNTPIIEEMLETLFKNSNISIIKKKDFDDSFWVSVMTMEEAINMFRQELEYHVIRYKFPVWISADLDEKLVKITLANMPMAENLPEGFTPLFRFDEFRKAERYIKEVFKSVKRLEITSSRFKEELNLLVVYKVK